MAFPGISRALDRSEHFRDAVAAASVDADISVVDGLDAPLLSALVRRRHSSGKPPVLLVVAPTGRRVESLMPALQALLPEAAVLPFPAWETLPHERLSPSPETVGRRLETLARIASSSGAEPVVVVASVRAALQPLAAGLAEVEPVRLRAGERGHDLPVIVERLVELAYHRVDMVSRRGEFAVRGGILDVFPTVADHPYRVEFFGDEVDQIRTFSVADQRSLPGAVDAVELLPGRELLLTADVRSRARQLAGEFAGLQGMLEKMAEGIPAEGMESLTPALVPQMATVINYLPEGAAVALVDPERSRTRARTLAETNREFLEAAWSAATAGARTPIDLGAGDFLTIAQLREAVHDRSGVWWTLSPFDSGAADAAAEGLLADDLDGLGVGRFECCLRLGEQLLEGCVIGVDTPTASGDIDEDRGDFGLDVTFDHRGSFPWRDGRAEALDDANAGVVLSGVYPRRSPAFPRKLGLPKSSGQMPLMRGQAPG